MTIQVFQHGGLARSSASPRGEISVIPKNVMVKQCPARYALGARYIRKGGMTGGSSGSSAGTTGGNGIGVVPQAYIGSGYV